jgi:DNA-binding GntR family transcriptional regulator
MRYVYDRLVTFRTEPAGSAKARAYEYVKHLVLTNPAQSGAFLTEDEVASALGVSRTPVREAFLRLEAEHLIQLLPRRGAFVTPVSSHEMADVMEARRAIETYALAQAADPIALGERLGALLDAQRAHGDDAEEFIARDRAFHQAMVDATGNRVLQAFYESLRDRMLRMGVVAVHRRGERVEQVLAEHETVVAALRRGETDAACKALSDHLESTLSVLVRERP